MSIMAGSHTVRIEIITGGRTRLDYLGFYPLSGSGVEEQPPSTWGRLKALYR
jgi:hypothetical protein